MSDAVSLPNSSSRSRLSYGSGLPSGAIQYHDVDLDILNLENADGDGSQHSFRPISDLSNEDEYGNPRSPEFVEEITLSKDGVLCEHTISKGLTKLSATADGLSYAYLNLNVAGYELLDITILQEFNHLQRIDLSHNKLTNLSVLSNLPFLVELNVSHNLVTTLLGFTAPRNLCIADFSHNKISTIGDLSAHRGLQKLVLDCNEISKIGGLSACLKLRHLSLNHNKIEAIEGLDCLPLQTLHLSYNCIEKITGLESLQRLQDINLAGNKIRSLHGLENHEALTTVDLEDNEVIDISELQFLQNLRILRNLNLAKCPVQEVTDYRLMLLFELPRLTELDRQRVEIEEKVRAKNLFCPNMEISSQRDHRLNMVYSFFQPHTVLDSTLQSAETPYPMLILAGPQGSGKKELSMKLTQEFPDFFGYGVSHTTRKPYPGEENGRDYHFVTIEEFETLQMKGKFIQTNLFQGHLYGLTLDALEVVAREGLACVVHMELEGVLATKLTYLEPRYVLTMPLDRHMHEKNLRQKGVYQDRQIAHSLQRSEHYEFYNRQYPGFFDMVINTNDILEAYIRLRRLVMDYLGLNSSDEAGGGRSRTADHGGGGPHSGVKTETRTWSKASVPISASQLISGAAARRSSFKQTPPGLSTGTATGGGSLSGMGGRGSVEQESLKRRHSEARIILSGVQPSAIEEALKRSPLNSREGGAAQEGGNVEVNVDAVGRSVDGDGSESSASRAASDNSRLSDLRANGSVKGDEDSLAGDIDTARNAAHSGPDSLAGLTATAGDGSAAAGGGGGGSVGGGDGSGGGGGLARLDLLSSSGSERHSNGPPAAPRPGSGSASRRRLPPLENPPDIENSRITPTSPLGQARWESPRLTQPEN